MGIYAKGSNGVDTTNGIYYSPDWGNTWQKLFSRKTNAGGAIMDMSIPGSGVGYLTLWRSVYKNDNLISLPEPINEGFGFYPNPTTGIV
ncbi:MAG: hypothetical protein U5L96_17475 [Owenweeksia sp.]|nr:hypothetical protein [Owenweeksia sp.]